ncbi:hypothetical protein RSP795_17525 [Ralstonia solanacearum]|nr:hypothetical protein RSP795_17525 [Ralstonia solanacearum]
MGEPAPMVHRGAPGQVLGRQARAAWTASPGQMVILVLRLARLQSRLQCLKEPLACQRLQVRAVTVDAAGMGVMGAMALRARLVNPEFSIVQVALVGARGGETVELRGEAVTVEQADRWQPFRSGLRIPFRALLRLLRRAVRGGDPD